MGRYINQINGKALGASFLDKCTALKEAEAKLIKEPTTFNGKQVCVVDNGPFAAAGYAYNQLELNEFRTGMEGRPHQWFEFKEADKWAK